MFYLPIIIIWYFSLHYLDQGYSFRNILLFSDNPYSLILAKDLGDRVSQLLEFFVFHIEHLTYLKSGEFRVGGNKWDCSCNVGEWGEMLEFRWCVLLLLLCFDFLFFSVFLTFHFNMIISRSTIPLRSLKISSQWFISFRLHINT